MLAVTALLASFCVDAAETPSPAALYRNPAAFVGRMITVRAVPCADVPDGFLCLLRVGSSTLRIEAGGLGAATSLEIAERLIETCKGEGALERSACRFDVTITPRAGQTEALRREFGQSGARLYSGDIDMKLAH